MRNVSAWAFSAIFLSLSAGGAAAQTCSNPQLLSAVDLAPIPGDNRVLVPVTVNGVDKNLLLDTAGLRTSLTPATLDALHLRPSFNSAVRLLDKNGNASHNFVNIDSLQFGNMRTKTQLMVTPDPKAGVNPAFDGILAIDLMTHYDIEMDFAGHRLNYFSADHCPGKVVYWPAAAIGMAPISVKNFAAPSRSGPTVTQHLLSGNDGLADPQWQAGGGGLTGLDVRTRVTLDGKEFTAAIDTGAANSTMSAAIAKAAFDVALEQPEGSDHAFHSLSFGDVTVTNPHFTIRPDMMGDKDRDNNFQVGSHIARADDNLAPDLTIGMNVLSRLHLYLAFKEGKLYITPATAQAAMAEQAKP